MDTCSAMVPSYQYPSVWGNISLQRQSFPHAHAMKSSRTDRRGHVFQVQQLPRQRATAKDEEIVLMGQILEACVQQNSGRPPCCIAYDNHGSFLKLNCCLLGLMSQEDCKEVPFFKDCVPHPTPLIPLFRGRTLRYGKDGFAIFGCSDPRHIQKAGKTWENAHMF